MPNLDPVQTDAAPAAIGAYSQAIVTDDWVFCSGQIPLDPVSGEIERGAIADQTDLVLRNLRAVLEAAGASLETVVKTTVYLADMGDFTEMNDVYGRHFSEHQPARAAFEVGALPKGCGVEIECVARLAD